MRIAIIHFMDGWSRSDLSRSKDDGIPKISLIPHLQWWILYPYKIKFPNHFFKRLITKQIDINIMPISKRLNIKQSHAFKI